jgi:hypothetical protein
MTYEFYKFIHMMGLMFLFFGFGGLLVSLYSQPEMKKQARMMAFATHGLGLLLMIFGGFGMAAKMGLMGHLPGWIHAKIAIWVLMALAISVVKRKASLGWSLVILLVGLGSTAAYLAINKPF